MKTIRGEKHRPCKLISNFAHAFVVAVFLFGLLPVVHAISIDPGDGSTNSSPSYTPLDSWWFSDRTNWTSDTGYAPVSFSNVAFSPLGNLASVLVDSTNAAWLQYNVYESDGATNLAVDTGTVMFWFAPGNWSSTNMGGIGPGGWGRLFELGNYTTNSSYGWWSLYFDPDGANLYFSTQTNDLSGNYSNYLTTPIAWTTNYFHFIALTYSATNTALYLDGTLATNGPPLTVYPGPDVLTNGFFIGSDRNGDYQAHGLFNSVVTYNVPLDAGIIQDIFDDEYSYYMMNPYNMAMEILHSAHSSPSISSTPNVVTGQGNLQSLGASPICSYGTNAYQVWITNITATAAGDGTMNVTFTIAGGDDGYFYDVFATSALHSPLGTALWAWQGQGQHCQIYSLTNMPNTAVFLILGTPLDSDGDGLTDAYESLVRHTDPNNPDTDGDGLLDGWEVLLGLNPLTNDNAQPASRANYNYTLADWLNEISGIKSGTVGLDNEGNVLSASQ
ncbi:MAG TPA: LamG-like jellyroll fold domain-containing protein [Verrucomicrobiae bacterium]|nr:LamG-like jellyroll fold domain-containing protein [Verrucomicrobiae bacterium]